MRFPGFIGPGYTSQSVNVDCQRCVNLFPEVDALGTGKEGEVSALVPTPGLRLLLTLAEGPTRGVWSASNGQTFVVSGSKLYLITSTFLATELGTLSTVSGPVSIADNGTHVVIVDGTYGYYWNINTSTFSKITAASFYPSDQVTFQDGYFIFNKANSQQFFISGLNNVTFSPTDIASAEGSPDFIVGLMSINQNLTIFGSKSIEVYYNSGDANFPFSRIQGAVVDVGCSAPFSIAKLTGSIYWLGGDSSGYGIVYRSQGYQAQRISTPAIESVIRAVSNEVIFKATAYTYQQGGHLFYCLNIPGTNSTWVYDASTELWHERSYLNLLSLERHRSECHAVAYGLNIVGDYQSGKIYALDPNKYSDDGTSIPRIRTSPHLSKNLKFNRHNSFQLDMETGVGLSGTGQGTDPEAMIRWSDDGGNSWSNEYRAKIGKIGNRKNRVIWRRLGMARDRVYEVRITDPVKTVLIGAEIDIEAGVA